MICVVKSPLPRSMPLAAEITGTPAGSSGASARQTSRRLCVGTVIRSASQPARAARSTVARTAPGSAMPGSRGACRVRAMASTAAASRAQSRTRRPARAAARASAAP